MNLRIETRSRPISLDFSLSRRSTQMSRWFDARSASGSTTWAISVARADRSHRLRHPRARDCRRRESAATSMRRTSLHTYLRTYRRPPSATVPSSVTTGPRAHVHIGLSLGCPQRVAVRGRPPCLLASPTASDASRGRRSPRFPRQALGRACRTRRRGGSSCSARVARGETSGPRSAHAYPCRTPTRALSIKAPLRDQSSGSR